jgi:hypothetical protein
MPTPRFIAAAFGAAMLAGAAIGAAPAGATPLAAGTAQTAQADTSGLVQNAWHRGRPHYHGHRRYYGRPIHRPRCFWTNRRVWTGHGWVVRRVRVCR